MSRNVGERVANVAGGGEKASKCRARWGKDQLGSLLVRVRWSLELQGDSLDSTKTSLDLIQKQLNSSGRVLLQGSLLKRSETLRKWNQRWFTLDPTTGKLEYRIERGDIAPKGLINFDAGSSMIISPLNFQGSIKYDGCCIYIQTSTKKEYFLCAETPKAANAWVSTLRAAVVVLKAHKEAVNSLGGNGSSSLGTVPAAVAAANATAKEAAKDVVQSSTVLASKLNSVEGLDNLSIVKETLKVKDDELHQMAKDIRARDATIQDLAQRLSATAEAAEAAASAAHIMDKERQAVRSEMAQLRKELDVKLQHSSHELMAMKEKLSAAEKARDEALTETLLWQGELAKAREQAAVMQAALNQAEAKRDVLADTEVKMPESCAHIGESVGDVHGKGPKFEAPAHPQMSSNTLSSMHNGIEELLLDLDYVERRGSTDAFVKPPPSDRTHML
ncbi:hypothetical protein GOP47_0020640 [Adiantum capillus-veneris]|uniref:PH domain-containing protein n=1 Tax=Adiantum capillus-veneris TaxID=13818 RepID=A0A9D4Z7M6_ADICA|nr:hypothetical protein GOP47_0020640 [Adiantum capillus-veneris]